MKDSFSNFYQKIYAERWPKLLDALLAEPKQVARVNRFALKEGALADFQENEFDLAGCCDPKIISLERISDLIPFYVMDPASVLAARMLPVHSGEKILDLCAAPGGKSLILAEALNGTGELICNELSSQRRERLKKVLQQYIPQELRLQTWIKGMDGTQFGMKHPEAFDAILVDAPCSGEAHLLQQKLELEKWTLNWTKKNAMRQYALLSSAYLSLKSDGYVLYSTCSISPFENEEVVGKILKRRPDLVPIFEYPQELRSMVERYAESREYGHIFLPDHCGFGPLYFCLLQKKAEKIS